MTYEEFLRKKEFYVSPSGFEVDELNDHLFDYQKAIVKWALRKGQAALFEDTGLGKTIQQLSWADSVNKHTHQPVLILAPLAVAEQTAKEAAKFGMICKLCESHDDIVNGVNITNYEKIHKFDTSVFSGIVLDESSIIKSYSGKTTKDLQERFKKTPFKLCCTATPSPNDYTEIGTTAEFLGVMPRSEMLSTFFINDSMGKNKNGRIGWRLKGHAEKNFFKWISSWAMMIKNPSDIGFDGTMFELPKLNLNEIIIETETDGSSLFVEYAETLDERRKARKESVSERVQLAKKIAESSNQCLVWCDYNYESEALHKAISNSVEVKGSDLPEHKKNAMIGFSNGDVKCLISKPSICGFGMNWQNCHEMIFCGLSDSYEQFYQAIRRCWRFGQKSDVNVYVIISEKETEVLRNIKRKQSEHERMTREMIAIMSERLISEINNYVIEKSEYKPMIAMTLPQWLQAHV